MEGFEMPRGYRWDKGEGYRRLEETAETQKYAILLAVVFVLLLMGGLFESFVLPFSVLLSIPFSFLGVYWTLYLTDTPFDQTATIGSVILIGVVVKNGIVLIDRINQLRVEGMVQDRGDRDWGPSTPEADFHDDGHHGVRVAPDGPGCRIDVGDILCPDGPGHDGGDGGLDLFYPARRAAVLYLFRRSA